MNFVPLITNLEPSGIVHLFNPYLNKPTEHVMGDQVKDFAKTAVNNIHCSPFACTDLPHVLEYNQVGWVQSNLVLAIPSHILVLHVASRRTGSVVTWVVLADPRSCFLQMGMIFAMQRGRWG